MKRIVQCLGLLTCLSLPLALISCDHDRRRAPAAVVAPTPTPLQVQVTFPSGNQQGIISLSVTLTNSQPGTPSADPLPSADLELEWSTDGLTFQPMTLLDTSPLPLAIEVASTTTLEFLWDSFSDTVDFNDTIEVTLRLKVVDSVDTQVFLSSSFSVENLASTVPNIVALDPDQGAGGTEVVITGFNLGDLDSAKIMFGEHEAILLEVITSELTSVDGVLYEVTVAAPPEVATSMLSIQVANDITVEGPVFHGAPRIDAVTPAVIDPTLATTLFLRGQQLMEDGVQVEFRSAASSLWVSPVRVTDDLVEVVTPSGLSAPHVAVYVHHRGGTSNGLRMLVEPATSLPAVTLLRTPHRVLGSSVPVEVRLFQELATQPTELAFEFSLDGERFEAATLVGTSHLNAAASAIPTDAPRRHVWDAASDLGRGVFTRVQLRVTPMSTDAASRVGASFTSAPLWIDSTPDSTTWVEEFDDNAWEDAEATSADWNGILGTTTGRRGALVARNRLDNAPWGTAIDGAFHARTSLTLTTDGSDPLFGGQDGVFEFSSFTIDRDVIVTVVGSHPLQVGVTGAVNIEGTLDLSGNSGAPGTAFSSGSGGNGRAGGTAGGAGGALRAGRLTDGESIAGGGAGGISSRIASAGAVGGGGGGAGFGSPGIAGSNSTELGSGAGGSAGIARGSDVLVGRHTGTGGGGGGARLDSLGRFGGGGGGGGAGAGLLRLTSNNDIRISGAIRANGGRGGNGFNTGSGGGGSGGCIALSTTRSILFESGFELSARGGQGGVGTPAGGAGGSGRIFLNTPFPVTLPTSEGSFDTTGFTPPPGAAGFAIGNDLGRDLGTAADGTLHPTTDLVLTTDGVDPLFGGVDGEFHFDQVTIPEDVTVRVHGSRPLIFRVTGDIDIAGVLDLSGRDAATPPVIPPTPGVGGTAGPGGGNGGRGGFYDFAANVAVAGEDGHAPLAATNLESRGRGAPTLDAVEAIPFSSAGGGGGAGHSVAGIAGNAGAPPFGTAGGTAGQVGDLDFRNAALDILLVGGFGGGGGGGNINDSGIFGNGTPGGGGGGGGGACLLVCDRIMLSGTIDASGGNGARSNTTRIAGNGGGGAGGSVFIQAQQLEIAGGVIDTGGGISPSTSGTAGGNGSPGRILLELTTLPLQGVLSPAPAITKLSPTSRFSQATSQPIPLARGPWLAFARNILSVSLLPTDVAANSQRQILWGGWQRQLTSGEPFAFTGFTTDIEQLPPCDFLQFQVLFGCQTLPPTRLEVERIAVTTD